MIMSDNDSLPTADYTEAQKRGITEIQHVVAELRVDRLSRRDFDRFHRMSGLSTAGYQFGSWTAAVAAAGLDPYPSDISNLGPKISDEELLQDLLRLEAELGTRPSERKTAAFGRYSPKPYKDRWKSVANAFDIAKKRCRG